MTGNRRKGIVLTSRDFDVLRALSIGRVMDREQLMSIARFSILRRANSRLLKLVQAGLLKRLFIGTEAGGRKALYTLTKNGAGLIAETQALIQHRPDELLVADSFIAHQLIINSIWPMVQYSPLPEGYTFVCWRVFKQPLATTLPLIPDSYFELRGPNGVLPMFLEVDRGTESQSTWTNKTELYLKLATSSDFKALFRHERFRVLVVATSERRLQNIRRTVARKAEKVFWFTTFEAIKRSGMWSPIWFRPTGDSRTSLL